MTPKGATIKVFRFGRFKTEEQPAEASLKLIKIGAAAAEVEAAATEVKTAATKYEISLEAGKCVNVVQYVSCQRGF